MRQSNKWIKVVGRLLFLLAIALFCLQISYFVVNPRFQVEYIDNRLFYLINIGIVLCLFLAMMVLLKMNKLSRWISFGLVLIFTFVNGLLLVKEGHEIKSIVSFSPDFQNILVIKEDTKKGETRYYRSYYGILVRPKEKFPYQTIGNFNVKWLVNDIAAVTYKANDNKMHQFIATYGDRGGGSSYYYVGAEIHGRWKGEGAEVTSAPEGIMVRSHGITEFFKWNQIIQFGTLAVVLRENEEAVWTIALNDNFKIDSSEKIQTTGEIILYKATLNENESVTLRYEGR